MFQPFKNLLFKNVGIRQTVFKNTFWLVLAEVFIKILALVLTVYVVRILGVTEYGKFAFAVSFVSIMAIFSDLGVVDAATRELSRSKANERHFSGIFTLEVVLCAITLAIAFVGSFFITPDFGIRKVIWILSLFFLSNSLFGIIFAFLRARQKMEYEALSRIFQSLANTVIVSLAIFLAPSIENVSYGYLFSNLAVLLGLMIFFSLYFQPIRLGWETYSLDILKISWPLSLGFMTSWIYISINSVMLGYFGLIIENGWYNAAAKIAIVAMIPASLITRSFFPLLSNFFVSSQEKLQNAWDHLAGSMILLSVPIVTGGVVLAPKIIHAFYGADFQPSVLALQLLIGVAGISFINFPYSVILVVADQQKKNFSLIIFGAVVNIMLNIIFISLFGFYGAIFGTLISSLSVLVATVTLCHYLTPIHIFNKKLLRAAIISSFVSAALYLVISIWIS